MIHGFKVNGRAVSHREFCKVAGIVPKRPKRKGFLQRLFHGAGVDIVYQPPIVRD